MALLLTGGAIAGDATPPADSVTRSAGNARLPDSKKLEKDLQSLPWNQFRAVVEAVPKLKADVERYGPTGWKYVEVNFQSYGWKKNIDKLDDEQRKLLVELIRKAKDAR
jgi:hypothetical protein